MAKKVSARPARASTSGRCIKAWWLEALAALVALSAVSCAGASRPPETHSAAPPAAQKPSATPEKRPAPTTLSPLPPTAQGFLADLQDHIRKGDWAWAADQSDASFLRAMEGRPRDSYFYTYLFSAGVLSTDSQDDAQRFETLPLAKIRDMAWDSVVVEGPVAVVRGRFLLTRGESVPFAVRLVWRIEPLRILGSQP